MANKTAETKNTAVKRQYKHIKKTVTKTSQTRVLFQRTLSRFRMGVFAAFLAVGVSLSVASLLIDRPAQAATASTLNFQARLLNKSGSIVTDGKYNVEFKLYNTASAGTALWSETYYDSNGATAGNDNRVTVRAGYLSVYLGSQNAFPNTINWDQDLYLTMNIGGTTQTATPTYDGEMNPRIKLTAVPYAFKAGQLAQLNAATGFTSTLKLAQPTVGNQDFVIPDQGAAGTFTLLTTQAANAAYIQNQNSLQQASAQFWISGSGRADTSFLTPAVDTATATTLTIGATNATAVSIAKTGVATTVNGSLTVTENATFNGNVAIADGKTLTVGTGATTLGGTLTVNGAQFTNAGATLNTALALTDFASGGVIGTAAGTVDVKTSFTVNQTTGSQTLSLPAPTDTAAGRIVYVSNVGSAAFTMHSTVVAAGGNATFLWNGTMWRTIVDSGISAVGTLDSQTKSADGAVVVGSGLYLQTADANFPGLVSTGTQTFAGNKTFVGGVLFKPAVDSNFALEVQGSGGGRIMRVDSTNQKVAIGAYSQAAGNTITGQFEVTPTNANRNAIVVIGAAGQLGDYYSASLAGSNIFRVQSSGNIQTASGVFMSNSQSADATNSNSASFKSGDVSGANSASGVVTFSSGNSTTSGNTGSVTLKSGNATNGNSGGVTIDAGTASGTAGQIYIGTTSASTVNIARTGVLTSVYGSLSVGGTQFTNAGATLNTALALSDFASDVPIGTAAATVDIKTSFTINQTTTGRTLSLPAPTTTTAGRIVYVSNIGTASFTMHSIVVNAGGNAAFIWNGSAWKPAIDSGISAVGTLDSQTKSADGAVVVGSALFLQTADATNAGLVSTGAQTIAGAKTFSNLITGSAGLTVSGGAISLTGNAPSSFTTTTGDLTLQAGSGNISLGSTTNLSSTGTLTIATGSGNLVLTATGAAVNVGGGTTTSVNLQQNTTVAGTKNFTVTAGNTSLTGAAGGSSTAVTVNTGAATNVGLVVQGAASQTADLLQVKANGVVAPVLGVSATGAASFRNSVDGPNALQVLNSVGNNIVSVGTSTSYTLLLGHSGTGVRGQIGTAVSGVYQSTSTTTNSFNFAKSVPTNHTLIGSLVLSAAAAPTVSVTDSKGNSYTVHIQTTSGSNVALAIFSSVVSTPLTTSDTINITISSGTGRWLLDVQEFDNILTSGALDKTATNTNTGIALSSGVAGVTTDANELVFGTFGYNTGRTFVPTNGFTASTQLSTTAGSNDRSLSNVWKFVTTTGTQEATGTVNISSLYAAGVVTFRVNAVDNGAAAKIAFNDGSSAGYVASLGFSGNLSGNRDIYLPDASGTLCLDSGNCSAAGGYIVNGTALQTGNFNISGTGTAGTSFLAPLLDTAAAGTLSLGTGNATAVSISKAGVTTTVNGALNVAESTTVGGTFTVNGTQFTNAGATLNTALALNDFASNATIGTAAATVDIKTSFTINQTTTGRTLSLPNPTSTAAGRVVYVSNIGTASFTMHTQVVGAGANAMFVWNGTAWKPGLASGISAIGTLDSQTKSADGAVVVGSALFLQTADATNAGLMGTGTQTFAGDKTFGGQVTLSASGTGLSVTNSASIGGNLTVTGSISGNGVNAGSGLLQGTGGLTVTGATNINTTGTANTAIGNATGTFSLVSSTLNISTAGALTGVTGINTNGSYTQTGTSTNTFTGVTNFTASGTALSVTNNATIGGTLGVTGSVSVGGGVAGAQISAASSAAGQVTAAFKGATGQTANLLELQNSSNEILARFGNTGQLTLGRISATGTAAAGVITFADGTNSNFGATLTPATLTANRSFLLPDSSLATTASPATFCVFNGTTSNCPIAPGSPHYIQNGTTVQSGANFYIRSASANSVGAVIEGANSQTADLLNLNSFNGTTSTTVARVTAAGNLELNADGAQLTIGGNTVGGKINFGDTTGANSIRYGAGELGVYTSQTNGFRIYTDAAVEWTIPEFAVTTAGTAVNGTLNVADDTTLDGNLTVNGSQFTNTGATLNTALALGDFATGGAIGTAAATVDIKTTFTVNQTTADQTLSLPSPTNTAAGRVVYVSNIGSASFTMNNAVVPAAGNAVFLWNGTAWKPTVEAGISAVGNLDAQPKSADGATVFAGALYLQTADATHSGLVSTGDQTFAGNKTFNGTVAIQGAGTGLDVANNAAIGGNLTVTGTISGNGVNAGSGLLQGTGGLTVTGAVNINTTGTANTSIGNATGSFSLNSSGLKVSTAGALTGVTSITTSGGYTQSGSTTNTFTGATSFTASGTGLSVSSNLSAGSVNNLTLTAAADGFSIAGGTTNSRTLTVTGANITVGDVIRPTNPGSLAVRSNGASILTLDAGGSAPVNVGVSNASSVSISKAGSTTTVNGALTTVQLLTGQAGATISGGAISLTGNAASSLTTSSGALTLTSAAAATWSTSTGDLTIQAGSGTVSLGTSTALTANGALNITSGGAMTIDAGSGTGLSLGATDANGVSISRTGVATTVNGTLTVAEDATFDGNVDITGANTFTVGTGATTLGGTLTAAGNTTLNGGQFTNNGSTVNGVLALGDVSAGGNIGTAASTVDVKTAFSINQTTSGQTLTLPTPTDTTAGRIVYVSNIGTTGFTMYGSIVAAGANASFVWNGAAWNGTATAGVTALGTVDAQPRAATGASIVGSVLYLQTADATNPGLMGTGAQTFAGAKTFNSQVTLAASGSGLSVTNNASIGGTLTVGGNVSVTGSVSATGVNAGSGLLQGTGGLTVTGATNINTTGTASTSIGNTTGSFSLQSSGLKVSTAGALTGVSGITTSGGYLQSGTATNTFTGASTFSATGTALTVTNNISAGTVNNLTLTAAADGFTVAGGSSISRTLTVTGANITVGDVIRPTNPGVLGVQSNGANALNLDAGGAAAVNVGTVNANGVNIANTGVATAIRGAATISELLTGNGGATISGGAIALSGSSASSFTTSSGALTLTSAAAATWSTSAGDLTIQAGSGTVSLGTSTSLTAGGALTVTSGGATTLTVDAGGAAALNLGTTSANAVSISRTGVATTINGSLTVQQAATFNNDVSITGASTLTVGTGATTLGGTLSVNGAQFANAGATLFSAGTSLGDFASGGSIGGAASTVDVKTSFIIGQTTASQTLSLPSPTITTAGRIVYVMNRGTTAFTMHNMIINPGSNASFIWNGTAWNATADAGVAAVGTIDSRPKSANGAVILGSGLYMQTADATNPGLVSTGTQTFAGAKTFNGQVTLAAGGTGLSVTNNATIGGTLGVTGAATFSSNISQSGAGTFSTGTGNVTLNGAVSVSNANTFTVGTGATQLGGTLAVTGNATFNGSQLTNNGSTVNTSLALANFAANGPIGTAAATVNIKTSFTINQTTSGITLSLPSPTDTTAGRVVYVSNVGSTNFTIGGAVIAPGATIGFIWNGTAWATTGSGAGVSYIGTIDSQTKSANGAVISGNTLYLQTADQSNVGLVSTIAQTFAGAKTFTDLLTANAGMTVSGGAISLTGNTTSSFTTTSGTLNLQGFDGVTVSTPSAAGSTSNVSVTTGNSTTAGNSGTVTIRSGNAAGGTAGDVIVDTGTSSTGTPQVNLGTTNAGLVSIGRNGFGTTVNGSLTVAQLLTGNAGATIGGGAIALTGSTNSSFTTSSGALTLTSATGATWSTTTGNLIIQAGSGTVSLGTSTNLTASGALTVRSGGATAMAVDAGGAAVLNLGTTNANAVSVSRTGIATTINGSLTVQQATTFNGDVSISNANTLTVGTGLTQLGGALTVAGNATFSGTQLTNNGSTVNSVLALGNFASDGPIGTAAATVDIKSGFTINQTTAGRILSIPAPTDTAAGRIVYVSNIGTQAVVISGLSIAAGSNGTFLWNGSAWKGATEGGASAIGTIDSQTKSANGAVIVGNLFYFQTADATNPGLVSTGDQTFAGNKTFNGTVTISGAGTGLSVANDASIGGTLTVGGNVTATGSVSATGVNAGTGLLQGTGGLTVTGDANINTTGTANTSIGNATGSFSLTSAGLNISTAGALTGVTDITTTGGYNQTGTATNSFTGVTSFTATGTALSVTNNISAGTFNNLGLANAADGFSITGGSTNSRTLTVTGGSITVGNIITPTAAGTLQVRSNGANTMTVDAGASGAGAILNLGTTNANTINIGRTNFGTTVNGTLTVAQLLTGQAGATVGGGAIALTGNANSSFTTTNGGVLTLTSAAAATWSTTAGTLTIQAGSGTVSLGSSTNLTASGALTIDSGTTATALNLGTTNASAVSISRNGVMTTVNGNLTVTGTGVFRNTSNTATAFQIQKSDSSIMLNVDTQNGWFINNASTQAGNLIENPSFESNAAFSAGGWTYGAQGAIASDAANAHGGNNVFTVTPNSSALTMSTTKYLAVAAGEQYYAELWYKTASGTDGGPTAGSVSLRYYDANKASIGSSSLAQFNAANNSYTRAVVNGTVPAGAVYMRLAWGLNATSTTGTWYFDDFYMTKSSQQSPMTFKNNVDSTTAFQVQNAAGNQLFTVDTTGSQVVLGKASALDGKLTFQNATNTNTVSIVSGTTSTSYQLTLPTALGGAGQCLVDTNGSGALGFTSCVTSTVTLQSAYTNSTTGIPEIKLDTNHGGIDIQDADASLTGNNFITLRGSNFAGLGTIRYSVGVNGNLYMKPGTDQSNLIEIRQATGGANGTGLFVLDSVNARLGLALGGTGTTPTLPGATLDVGGDIRSSTKIVAPAFDYAGAGTLLVGTSTATAVTIAKTNVLTTIDGTLSVSQGSTFNGNVSVSNANTLTVGTGLTQLGGNLTVAGTVQLNGTQVTNAGSTVNTVAPLGNFATGGNIGTAAGTVDTRTAFSINQTTTGQALSLPNPTSTAAGRIVYVSNVGSAAFTMYNQNIPSGSNGAFMWNGSAWKAIIEAGASVMGALDGQTRNANGATIIGSSLYLQTADATNPGLVSTGDQTFAGDKTFNGAATFAASGTGLTVTGNASIGSLSVGSITATGLIQGTAGLDIAGAVNINTTGSASTSIGTATGSFSLQSTGLTVATNGDLTTNGGYTQNGTTTNTFTGVTNITAANGLVLGASTSATGGIVFKGQGGNGTLTVAGPTTPNAGNYTLTIPTITANQTFCVSNMACAGFQAAPASGSYIMQAPTTAAQNTITPGATADGVIALTVNGTLGSTTTAMLVSQSQDGDGLNVRATNTTGVQTNGLTVNRNGVGGTTTNLLNLSNAAGTVTNGINFSGTYTNLINSTNFKVTNAGALTAVGINAGSGQIQGTGGLSVTGAVNINTSNNADTSIGNATGQFSLTSSALKVSTTGALTGVSNIGMNGSITQSGTASNSFTGTSSFATLTATTVNALTLGAAPDGFTLAGGSTTSRMLTVTSADITIGNVIRPTNTDALTVRSTGASIMTVDTGGAAELRLGITSANAVKIASTGVLTTVNGSLTVKETATFEGNISQTGTTNFSTGTGTVSINGDTTVANGKTFSVGTGATTLGGTLTVNGSLFKNSGATLNTVMQITNMPSGGAIGGGSAATTVDVKTTFAIQQTTAGQTISLPSPTDTTAGRIIYITNNGNTGFTINGINISQDSTYSFMWNGAAWTATGASAGVNTVGAFNTVTGSLNGATITGTTIYFQAADDSAPGMVSTGAQIFGGAKTFKGVINGNAGMSVVGGAISLAANNASGFTTSAGALTLTSATEATWSTVTGDLTLQAGSGTINFGATSLTSVNDLTITAGGNMSVQSAANKALNLDTGTNGVNAIINIGTGSAEAINIGRNNKTTTAQGHLNVQGNLTAGSVGNSVFTNNGATLNYSLSISDLPLGGAIGSKESTVDIYTAFVVNQTTSGRTISIPGPTNVAPGRIVYITSPATSVAFTLLNTIINPGTTATLFWNGTVWTFAGTDTNSILNQTSTLQNASFRIGGTGSISTSNASAFVVQNASGANSLTIDTQAGDSANLAVNGGAETIVSGAPSSWVANSPATVTSGTAAGEFASGAASAKVVTTGSNGGVRNNLGAALATSTTYLVSFSLRATGSVPSSAFVVEYFRTSGTIDQTCTASNLPGTIQSNFVKYTCKFTTSSNAGTTSAYLVIRQNDVTGRTFYVDNLSIVAQGASNDTTRSNRLIVGGDVSQGLTLFTLDKSAGPPQATGSASLDPALFGSMYFDTTVGRIQCYEASGWGSCGNSPDVSVNLIPEYTGAVLNGKGIGTMTADMCSDPLNINDGSGSPAQPTLCGVGESYNFYKWTSPQTASAQTYSIYIRYQLPATFKNFADDNTITLTGRTTDTTNGKINFSLYGPTGTQCGSTTDVIASGTPTPNLNNTWYTTRLGGTGETNCNFQANDIVMFKIDVTAQSNASVYVSNLSFLTKGK